jgi:hypothetical protein
MGKLYDVSRVVNIASTLLKLTRFKELKLCKPDIQRLENSRETGTSQADDSTTFRTAQSHLGLDTQRTITLPPPPALPFIELPLLKRCKSTASKAQTQTRLDEMAEDHGM